MDTGKLHPLLVSWGAASWPYALQGGMLALLIPLVSRWGALVPEDDGALQLCPFLFGAELQRAPVTPFPLGQARREGSRLSLQPSVKRRVCLLGTWPWGALSLVPAGHFTSIRLTLASALPPLCPGAEERGAIS